VQYAPN